MKKMNLFKYKKSKNIINKKAQIGATLTWVVAFLIIFFIMLLFISATIIISITKKASILSLIFSQKETVMTSHITGDFALQRNLISFLNKPIEFEGKKILIKDLIADKELNDENKARFIRFIEEVTKFMNENFPLDENSLYGRNWLRIYRIDEEISSYYSGEYSDCEVSNNIYTGYREACDPEYEKAISNYVFISPDKKIAICTEYK